MLRLIVFVALFALAGSDAGAQSPEPTLLVLQRLERYRATLEVYRAGDRDAAVRAALAAEAETYEALEAAMRQFRAGRVTDSRIDARFFQTAAVLHADAAFECWRTRRDKEAPVQLELARRLVDVADTPESQATAFRRRWYLATALVVSTLATSGVAFRHFERTVDLLPDDVPLLTAAGWFSERLAHGSAQVGASISGQRSSKRIYRDAATRFLTAALKLDPTAAEAALRLARVEMLGGRAVDAKARLAQLLARQDLEPDTAYVGRLLLGRLHEQAEDMTSAERLYREAMAIDPSVQSARVALGRVLYVRGDPADAADVVAPSLVPKPEKVDPWASYQLVYMPFGYVLFDRLRQAIR